VVEKKNLFGNWMVLKILMVLSFMFFVVIKLRVWGYKIGVFKRYRLNCLVISIGNIVVGGSGKTAFVQTLCNVLKDKFNRKSVVLLRGYGPLVQSSRFKVQGLENERLTQMVDEEVILRENLQSVPVLIGKDRVKNARIAIEKLEADVLILDDGYQYLKLHRNLNVILLKAPSVLEEKFVLPRGLLREPYTHLDRADVLIITDTDRVSDTQMRKIDNFLGSLNYSALNLHAIYTPFSLFDVVKGEEKGLKYADGKRFLAVCGIGDPASFRHSLEKVNLEIAEWINYPDHHAYDKKNAENILQLFKKTKSDSIITTQKDIYKLYLCLNGFVKENIKEILALKVKLELEDESKNKLYGRLHNIFNSKIS